MNKTPELIEERSNIYSNLKDYAEETKKGVVYFYNINLDSIASSVEKYVAGTLEAYFKTSKRINSQEELQSNIDLINSLPNITPNGQILPKKETIELLNEVQQNIIELLNKTGILNNIEMMMCPHIMIKTPTREFKERPYYTGQLHSDAWIGMPSDAIFMCGLLGDIDNTTVEYFEPINPSKNLLDTSPNYKSAQSRYTDLSYIGKMTKDRFIIMDNYCIHRTKYNCDSKARVSLAFGVIMKKTNTQSKPSKIIERFKDSFFNPKDLIQIGKTHTFDIDETLYECEQRHSNPNLSNTKKYSQEPYIKKIS